MQTNFKFAILVALSAAVTLLTGCESYEHKTAERSTGRMVDDKRITSHVKSELAAEPVYKFDDVQVKTFNGVVQLSGFVTSDEQKRRAEEIAHQVNGVGQVVNGITLKQESLTPTGRSESDVRRPLRQQ